MADEFPASAQVVQMMERMNHMASDLQEIKSMIVSVISMQRDIAHMDEKVRRLFELADQRGPEIAALDKRVASLERWHKIVGTAVLASLGVIGWGIQRVEYLYRMDNRIALLELQVNAQNIERSMEAPKISGPK